MRPSPDEQGAHNIIKKPIRFGPSMNITKIVQEVAGDDLTAVKISEVALQGVETKVSLIEIKCARAGRQYFRDREGRYREGRGTDW